MPPIPPNPDRSAVTTAIAELIGCSYLDVVPTPAENDRLREVAANARAAMDRLVVDANQWRKVKPLIAREALPRGTEAIHIAVGDLDRADGFDEEWTILTFEDVGVVVA